MITDVGTYYIEQPSEKVENDAMALGFMSNFIKRNERGGMVTSKNGRRNHLGSV